MVCFEFLPNEILVEIFKYFDAQQLFRVFYNLNFRFNQLLQSFDYLQLALLLNRSNYEGIENEKIFPFYVYTLNVDSYMTDDLDNMSVRNPCICAAINHFPNVRRLRYSLSFQLEELNLHNLSHLKQLEVFWLGTRVASNEWALLPSLRILKVSTITLSLYRNILSKCPSLYSFEFYMSNRNDLLSSHIAPYSDLNIKRMVIKSDERLLPEDNNIIQQYLLYVPNLERLIFRRHACISALEEYFDVFDWHAIVISIHLHLLKRFRFYLKITNHNSTVESDSNVILIATREKFNKVHNKYYQSKLILQCYTSKIVER